MTEATRHCVLYVSPVGERGGAETVLLNILRFQDRRRFDPVVCFLKPGPLVDEVAALGVDTVVVPAGRLRQAANTVAAIRGIRRVISDRQVDLVFGNMSMGHVYGGLAALGTPARVVWFQHGIPRPFDPVDWLAALVPATRIYVNSRVSAAGQRRLPRCAGRMQLLYYGLDGSRFSPTLRGRRRLLGAIGVQGDVPVVGMIARFQRWKGQDVFIRAAAEIVKRRPDVHFVLVGDTLVGLEPEFKPQLHALVAELGLQRHVTFAGFRDDVPELLAEIDIVAHPAVAPEPFGLAVAEAMLMERPVIASDSGGPAEIIVDGQTGWLVAPGDPGALAQRVLELLMEPSLGLAAGQAGRRSVLQRFSMERMIDELEASYAQVLGTTIH